MKIHFFCYSAYIQRRIGTKRNAKVFINDKNGKDTKSYKLVTLIDSAVLQGVFLNFLKVEN